MSARIMRVSKGYARIRTHLYKNEARCSRHVGIILRAYDAYRPHAVFPDVLRRYGITPETIGNSRLLRLCLEWRNEDTEAEVTFFNTLGKGNILEKLLQEYCPDLDNLYPIEVAIATKRDNKRKKVSQARAS